ncbi:Membrane associated serine protease, rhomboid family [Desulfonatronum thiosulfatophilum]|uniref:Membrane associated serine protease, rhomboid family n=1 Tax=Desulfonatronum thiosulfatophilum TaxID=617002 RepID=A0A1G6ATZ3_9BACT|nr:rhomboid family intramembrane serine protease [Desulfonatronum thiosulfatophilum]SDB11830.1 Membrane associated serine protease, rhomboid family [Desulfonatronum thiosulfatophilum]
MIPLRDNIPNIKPSYGMWVIISVNTAIFILMLSLSHRELLMMTHVFGMIPARVTDPAWALEIGYAPNWFITLGTHMFLHAGFLHFFLNMWMLWIFGDNVEDVMGTVRFLIFYLLCGLGAVLFHLLFNLNSTIPVIGASGAIAGIMGAYLLLYPHARVVAFIPIFFIPYFFEVPAVVFLGIWILIQVISGVTAAIQHEGAQGIAWWAHIGGFVAGMAMIRLFQKRGACIHCTSLEQWFKDHSYSRRGS